MGRSLLAGTLPWWMVLLLGLACVGLGAALTAEPFRSLSVLVWVAGAASLVTGVGELATARARIRPWLARVVGAAWIVAGVLAVSWPGITILGLAVAAGTFLLVGGLASIGTALSGRGDERFLAGIGGATSVVVGLLALSWPAVTVLVLAVVFGVRTVVFGFSLIALGFKVRRAPTGKTARTARQWPRPVRLAATVGALGLALAGVGISVAIHRAQPGAPGAFYAAPSPLPAGPPGAIIRSEVIDRYYVGATTYRVLYRSTGYDARPTAVSGLIVVPDGPTPPGGRTVLAYTHGTVGVATNCAPSLRPASQNPLTVEGAGLFIKAGYVIAATDYQGLGTPGPHPYLVGQSEAMNALDSVRAAHDLAAAHAGVDFAIWGHSQGGQAALFTAQLAAGYAPGFHLVGVAAGGPVPNLEDLFQVNIKTQVGKVLIAMALASWAKVYHDAHLNQVVTPGARPLVAKIAKNCLYTAGQILGSLPSALLLGFTFISNPPWTVQPWQTIAKDNNPGGTPITVPILVVQGDADTIVAPQVTQQLVNTLCASGETVDLRLYPGVGHVETSHVASPDVARWIADRFAGQPPPSTCP